MLFALSWLKKKYSVSTGYVLMEANKSVLFLVNNPISGVTS